MATSDNRIFSDHNEFARVSVNVFFSELAGANIYTIVLTRDPSTKRELIDSRVMFNCQPAAAIREAINMIDAESWRSKHELHIVVTEVQP
jgi:hypothetical protein